MELQSILNTHEISQADLSRGAGLSRAAVCRLVNDGLWPTRTEKKSRESVYSYLAEQGVTSAELSRLNEEAPASATNAAEAVSQKQVKNLKDDDMLLQNQNLTQDTKQHFQLLSNPFMDDFRGLDDVFMSQNIRYVRMCLEDAAKRHSMIAVIGESGAGKTTLVEAMEEKYRADDSLVIIKPYVLAMEQNDIKGKTLKSAQIAESITVALDPDAKIKRSAEARFRQAHRLLRDSLKAGRRHLLVIEEAHCLPLPTLKHLKRFSELKDGLQRLLGIALIGQPELGLRLSNHNPEVREVMQRCEVVTLDPLDKDLKAYLTHRLERVGKKFEDVFDEKAIEAIRQRLTSTVRGGRQQQAMSLCYPLVVNNLVCKAMNEAQRIGWEKVDADVIAAC